MCIHEMLSGDKGKYMTRAALEGCSPIAIIGNKICFPHRIANELCIHENSKESVFKQLKRIKAHDMIINAICGWGDSTLFTAGYDGKVKQWNLNTFECESTCDLGFCINALAIGSQGQIYAGGVNGLLNKLENK
ncbi:hypothetical protein C0J52_03747 [Blattella germanica]|nr:hypothetical protein C0J52_03747 [Blattella germanica]